MYLERYIQLLEVSIHIHSLPSHFKLISPKEMVVERLNITYVTFDPKV
jgi:hypothetical protein